MKYLIQNQKEFIISLGVFGMLAVVVFWCVWSIIHGTFDVKNILAIIGEIMNILGWYYNMGTSEINRQYTDLMRLEKQQTISEEFIGENFFDEAEEFEEDNIYDEDEEEMEGEE